MPTSLIVHHNDHSRANRLDINDPERYAVCDVGLSYYARERLRLRQIAQAKRLLAYLTNQQGK
jgi:hypothetical protein